MTELLKRKIIISAACLFTLIGTVAAIEPMCIGWFYRPEVLEILKGPITFVENDGPSSYGAGYRFPMTQQDNYYWAQSGEGVFTLYHNYVRHDLSAYAAYGHSTITVTPLL